MMKPCRECQHEISENALVCPQCGAPSPAQEQWDGWGYEYKSKLRIMGLPLIHIALKYRRNGRPVPARGVIAIGQFAVGVVTLSQFGIGIVSISQFTIAGLAVAQFAFAYSLIAQLGIYISEGRGQFVRSLAEVMAGF
jgi:hypothetical protein